MMGVDTFEKKNVVFVFTMDGDKLSFRNDNIVVTGGDGNTKLQTTCYRVFALFIVGHLTITSALIEKSRKFGFSIFLMTPSLRTYDIIGHRIEGNYILRKSQYAISDLEIARHLVNNKITNQLETLDKCRGKDNRLRGDMELLKEYADSAQQYVGGDVQTLMGIEGAASKIYFRNIFDMSEWTGRKPRMKLDFINATLDIGYTILFNMVDAMLNLYGFDTYVGVYHREFYMRRSLVCDLVEPFRPLIDWKVRTAVHIGQCKEEDFIKVDDRYVLNIAKNKDYVSFLMKPLLENKNEIFLYFQSYYRAFMKRKSASEFPRFKIENAK
jgi:CRISPR-associated endonuclease Cas1